MNIFYFRPSDNILKLFGTFLFLKGYIYTLYTMKFQSLYILLKNQHVICVPDFGCYCGIIFFSLGSIFMGSQIFTGLWGRNFIILNKCLYLHLGGCEIVCKGYIGPPLMMMATQ